MSTAIKIEGLSKIFRVGFLGKKVVALSDLNLQVERGETFGFLGPNGAGKTTTIKILMGLISPSTGAAWVLGQPLKDVRVKQRVGFLPEHPYFYDYLTAREFLHFYGQLFSMKRRELMARTIDLLKKVGLTHAQDIPLRKFSKGMLQRIGIAQALINDPDLVVLDEPMSGLDPIGRKEVRDLILHLRDDGKTVFFSTHIIPDVELICDRVGILLRGSLVNVGKLNEIIGGGLKYVEVVARWDGEKDLVHHPQFDGILIVSGSDGHTIRIPHEHQVEDVLSVILKGGGKIISVIPQRETLEEHFMKLADVKIGS